ncbi:MAG: hypothetical protein WD534_07635 [Phycisphaeraceae bacterium]
MRDRARQRAVTFDVIDDTLVRTVAFPFSDREGYIHRCTRKVYEDVAYAIQERGTSGGEGVTLDSLVEALDAPFTQVNVALEFMKERGCVVTRGRRSYPASTCLYEDAMVEYLFLAEAPD